MGAWRDLINQQGQYAPIAQNPYESIPTAIQAFKARFGKVIILTLATIIALALFFTAYQHAPSFSYGNLNWAPEWASTKSINFEAANKDRIEPEFHKDPHNGLLYPPDVNPAGLNNYKRSSATLLSLVRNNELQSMQHSMRGAEDRFNRKFGYPWVFLNDEDFTDEFKRGVSAMTRSPVYFGKIPKEHWSYPDWIDQQKAAEERKKMEDDRVIYGGSESYRHMCRFNSGFFFRHDLLQQFDYYWRVEPGVDFTCDVDYDVFQFMETNNKTYGFTITLHEYSRTIEGLWEATREFAKQNPQYIAPQNSLPFMVDDTSKGLDGEYNLCHFWSNFEIADMRFWRSEAYMKYFDHIDKTGGFFYSRYGDAPVHSIAAALFLPRSRIHQFDDIGYRHNPYTHCPLDRKKYVDTHKCFCKPEENFDKEGYSCMRQWWRVEKKPKETK